MLAHEAKITLQTKPHPLFPEKAPLLALLLPSVAPPCISPARLIICMGYLLDGVPVEPAEITLRRKGAVTVGPDEPDPANTGVGIQAKGLPLQALRADFRPDAPSLPTLCAG